MVKSLLINPPSFGVDDDRLEQHLGLAYIASYLEAKGFEVSIIELTGMRRDDFEVALSDLPAADVYGINCYSTSYASARRIIQSLRERHPYSHVCLGGPHPSAMPQATLSDLDVDSVVVGEGETAFWSIVRALDAGEPLTGVIHGASLEDLDELPFPNRTLVNQNTFSRTFLGRKTLSMIISRGCKYNCLHCNSIIMGGGARTVRFRTVKNIIEEIRYIKSLGYDVIRFNDDNFTDHPRLPELLEEIRLEQIDFRVFSRLEYLSKQNVSLLAQSGCKMISVGLESLNPRNLRFLGKGGMLAHIANLGTAAEFGIPVRVSFMVGLPYDTDDSIRGYFSRARELNFSEYAIYPLIPYPGTRIWSDPAKYHYQITNDRFDDYVQLGVGKESTFVLSYGNRETGNHFSPDDVRRWYGWAHDILSETKLHVSMSAMAR